MARTAQQVLESTIGQLHIQVCSLQAALDDANEKADALQEALDEAMKSPLPMSEAELQSAIDRLERQAEKA